MPLIEMMQEGEENRYMVPTSTAPKPPTYNTFLHYDADDEWEDGEEHSFAAKKYETRVFQQLADEEAAATASTENVYCDIP
jgi:hypothetical protein